MSEHVRKSSDMCGNVGTGIDFEELVESYLVMSAHVTTSRDKNMSNHVIPRSTSELREISRSRDSMDNCKLFYFCHHFVLV